MKRGKKLNKKTLMVIIIIFAVSIAGIVALNMFLANDNTSPSNGTMVLQSDITGVNVAILGPEDTSRTGVIGNDGELTFTGLPDGKYNAIATKVGYSNHYVLSTSIKNGGQTTVQIHMDPVPEQDPLHLSTNPSAIIVKQGNSKTVTLTVTSLNNYAGEVSMSYQVSTLGVTGVLNPTSGSITAGGTLSSTLTLTVSSTATKGIHQVYINLEHSSGGIGGYGLILEIT